MFRFFLLCAAVLLLAARFVPLRFKRAARRVFVVGAWGCLGVSLLALLRYWFSV
ncbi:protein MIGRI [Neisseria bacilliformis]|uniref:protein MIGRI n=1 Tax=Neisseria bacilliformis TaxID=267212 RepID=UPI001364E1BA|nr:hypothetical protein [Neisseria bacilliformis]